MKTNNVIVSVLLVLVSIFLLWFWYYLGFNKIDTPLDLVLSIIWWLMIAGFIFAIIQVEKRRKERIRTLYLSDNAVFNSEIGMRYFEHPTQRVDLMWDILDDLDYDFSTRKLPKRSEFLARYLIKTSKLKDDDWEGEVVTVQTKREVKFESKEELFNILANATYNDAIRESKAY